MIVSLVDNIVFLGEGEYEHASEKFKKLNSNLYFSILRRLQILENRKNRF